MPVTPETMPAEKVDEWLPTLRKDKLIVKTLEGRLIQLPEEKWYNNEPMYMIDRPGVTKVVSYKMAQALWRTYVLEKGE